MVSRMMILSGYNKKGISIERTLEMAESRETERRLALLIDGDNAQHSLIEPILEEVSRYGTVTIRRAYGDWTQPNLANWRPVMLAHAIQPIQQWRYTTGKNATDSALIIDAMDVLYSGTVQGFCIVSSDSDYTRLGTRIRESGLFVMGVGRKLTPDAFIKACDVFVHVENLTQPAPPSQPKKVNTEKPSNTSSALMNLLLRAFEISAEEDGWVKLSTLGDALHRLDPSFDSRTYGHKSLSLLIKSLQKQIIIKGSKKTGPATIYVRIKDNEIDE
jgi:uncharacterized LabA/DUF88 family protein